MSNYIYADNIYKLTDGRYVSGLYAEHNNISVEGLTPIKPYDLNGVSVRCEYAQLFNSCDSMILCNNIAQADEFFYEGLENGDLEYFEDYHGNIYNYTEREDKIEELTAEREEIESKIDNAVAFPTFDELNNRLVEIDRDLASLDDYHANEIFQWYIINDSLAEFLKCHTNELIIYNNTLDIYVLGVTHYGTSWDYVGTDFEM